MIIRLTDLNEIPKTCLDCPLDCRAPTSSRDPAKLLKPYLTKRHPKCPLRVIPDDTILEVPKNAIP